MRIKAHIYLSGIIGENTDFFSMEPTITANSVRSMIDENPNAEEYIFHITSRGGNVMEAFAIHDMIAGLKNSTTIGEGMVASAGTILLLSGGKRKMTKYSELMIHNPFTIAEGDADDLQKTADELQRIEDKLSGFYEAKTGTPAAKFDKWMKEEKYMNADEALELKFITEVIEPMKAVALLPSQTSKNQNSILMNIYEKIESKFSELKMALGITKNLELTDAAGKKFTVDTESNEDKASPQVNNTVNIEGKSAPDGDIIVPAMGKTITVASGKITAINDTNKEPEKTNPDPAATEDSAEVKELKAQVTAKDAKINELTAKVNENEAAFNRIDQEFTAIKSQIVSSGFVLKDRAQNFNKSTDKKEEKKNAFAEAADRRKEEREKKEGK